MVDKQEITHKREKLEDVVPRRAPFVIYLDPCGSCNFKCGFCPCNHSGVLVEERHKMMAWGQFLKIVEDIQAFEEQVKVIWLHGFGEPLLNPRIADMVEMLKRSHCCREVRITTNGSLLDERMSKALIEAGVDLIRVSVEALSSEGYRDICGVDMDFSVILRNVEAFYRLSRGAGSRISAKIISETLKTEEDKRRFYQLFAPITDYHFVEEIEQYWSGFDAALSDDHQRGIRKCYTDSERKEICTYPFTDMCIHSNGIVGACCVDWKFAVQYGDLNQEHLKEIWNGRKHREIQRAHLTRDLDRLPFCRECSRKPADPIEDPKLILEKIRQESGFNDENG